MIFGTNLLPITVFSVIPSSISPGDRVMCTRDGMFNVTKGLSCSRDVGLPPILHQGGLGDNVYGNAVRNNIGAPAGAFQDISTFVPVTTVFGNVVTNNNNNLVNPQSDIALIFVCNNVTYTGNYPAGGANRLRGIQTEISIDSFTVGVENTAVTSMFLPKNNGFMHLITAKVLDFKNSSLSWMPFIISSSGIVARPRAIYESSIVSTVMLTNMPVVSVTLGYNVYQSALKLVMNRDFTAKKTRELPNIY